MFSEAGGQPLMKRHPVRQRYRMVGLQRAGITARREISICSRRTGHSMHAIGDGVVIAALEAGHDTDRHLRRAC
jgi:hypothetical protein